jgi:dipeptidyl aminopeptidase/acylaminoacyl peptidase
MKTISSLVLSLAILIGSSSTSAQQSKRPFTVADEIGLTLFDAQGLVYPPAVHFSPDGKYVAVWTERGRVDLNQVEDSLHFYRTQDIHDFLGNSGSPAPKPAWVVSLTGKQYAVIESSAPQGWRWLADSSGVVFLRFDAANVTQQLFLADLRRKTVERLTPATQWVRGFDVRDRLHYVYIADDHTESDKKLKAESDAAAFSGVGTEFWKLFFPDEPLFRAWGESNKTLWAVVDGRRFEVKRNGKPVEADEAATALSPDGLSVVVWAPVREIPPEWAKLYLPPKFRQDDSAGLHPAEAGHGTVHQWARIDLISGSSQPLTDAPMVFAVGLPGAVVPPVWSSDGQQVILPDTFVKSKDNQPSGPCVALADVRSGSSRCIIMPKYGYERNDDPIDKYHRATDMIMKVDFAQGDNHRVLVTFFGADSVGRTTEYQLRGDGNWHPAGGTLEEQDKGPGGLELKVTRGFNDPPLLVAANKETSRVLWDPNPQLKDTELSKASVYKWKDYKGRDWAGGLYKPTNYQPGQKYPVVIQTHGFSDTEFRPSGAFSTAFAAEELAADGIVVLQTVKENPGVKYEGCEHGTADEALCMDEMIESAIKQLVLDGIADPDKIGIIGFSRTCYYVVDMLTRNLVHFKAASITDGVMMDYLQYLLAPSEEPERIFGAKPFGEGLQKWLKNSPSFNFDKVDTALLVNALSGRAGALLMYGPYSQLHRLNKPVDLMVFNIHEHILSNPAARMASQGGSVDWFRFWLQGYEDPDPAKAEQYARWRELRKLQEENEKKSVAPAH